jgi:putative addiction module killer protein
MYEILRYQASDGTEPFSNWLRSLADKRVQARIRIRIQRLAAGNFGDCKSIGSGVLELRIHDGPGYRVYFGRQGKVVVILLCGGTKSTQHTDIDVALACWADWKRRQP